jgi:hypothetical protein
MAELPRVPFPDSTTRPIKYNLSQADIAGPYTAIAQSAEKVSGALEDVAKPLAEEAGRQAVRRDDSGNLIVDRLPPIIGEAAVSARLATAAKLQPQIETDLLKAKLDNQYDPTGYAKAVGAYKPALLKGMDPALARGVDRMVDNTSQQYMRSILVEKDAHDTQEFKENTEAQLTRINDQTQVLARQQGGVESKEYSQLYQERVTLINALANNPRLKIPPEKRQLMLQQAHGDDMGQSIVGQAIRLFQTKANKTEAQRFLMDWAWGEQGKDLPLTPRQRDHFVTEGLKSLEGMSAEDSKAITAQTTAINGSIKTWMDNPTGFREEPYNDLMTAAAALGNTTGMRNLTAWRNFKPVFEDLSSQNTEDRLHKIELIEQLMAGYQPGAPQAPGQFGPPNPPVPINMSDTATVKMWNDANERGKALAAHDVEASHGELKYSIEHGHQISQQRLDEFAELAGLTRRNDLVNDLQPALASAVKRGTLTSEQSNAVISTARQLAAQTTDPRAQKYFDQVVKQTETDEKEKQGDPLGYANIHFGARPPGPLAPDKPDAFAGELVARTEGAATFHQREKTFGGVSYVSEAEAAQLYPQLTTGLRSEDAAKALGAFHAIPDTDRLATLTQPKMRDAVRDMSYSLDHVRVDAAIATMEDLYNAHPHEFKAAYGDDAMTHLSTALSLQGIYNSAERTELLNKPVDGRTLEARRQIEKDTKEKDLKDVRPEQILDKSFWITPGPLARAIGSMPLPPADASTASAFLSEWKDGVATLVGRGSKLDEAKKQISGRMANEWAVSDVNGGALMKYAPEKYYNTPPLPGDPGGVWMSRQLDEHITSILGPQVSPSALGIGLGGDLPRAAPVANWRFEKLVADTQSKYEAEHGLPVSYEVWVTNMKTGQADLLRKPPTDEAFTNVDRGSTRFIFKPGKSTDLYSPAGEAYEAQRIAMENAQAARARAAVNIGRRTMGRQYPADWAGDQTPAFQLGPRIMGAFGVRNMRERARSWLIGPPTDAKAHAEHRDAQ